VENQAKSSCLTENARRASLIALIFAPLLVLVSGALRNQQADNLLPAFFSTDHLGLFYWDQSRYGSIHSFLAFPIQNIRLNLLFQLHLRAASLVFLVVWIVDSCARVNVKTGKTSLQYMFALAFAVIFLCTFQEAGDALIYGANAHPIAIPFAILALSFQVGKPISRIPVLRTIAVTLWVVAFWGIAIWTSIFTALWAPALVLLQLAYIAKRENVFQRKYAIWFAHHVLVVGMWSWIFSQIAKSGGENTSFVRGKFVSEALKRSYVSVPLAIYLISAIIATVLVVFIGRNSTNVFALLSTVFFIGSVPVIAASTHVQLYSYMPRYFGVQYIAALLVLSVLMGGCIRFTQIQSVNRLINVHGRSLAVAVGLVFALALSATATSEVKFGTGKIDASGFVNTGYGITSALEKEILENMDTNLEFVAGSYWYVWPTVFDLRSRNHEVIAITKKATHQTEFSTLYSASPVSGICIGESIRCWGATINAQLDDNQLYFEIDSEVIGNLSDGTTIRKMWVSKYPLRRLER
jgi:hypothetical protein